MVEYVETFLTGIPQPPWIKVVNSTSDIISLNGQAHSIDNGAGTDVGNGNYLFYATEQIAITSITSVSGGVDIALQRTHEYLTVGYPVMVRLSGTTVFDGVQTLLVVDDTTLHLVTGIGSGWTNGTAYLNLASGIGNRNSIQAANVLVSDVGSFNYVALWSRFQASGGPAASLLRGYALILKWTSSTVRELQLLRTDPVSGLAGAQIVDSKTTGLRLHSFNSSDVGVSQRLVFIVTDNDEGIGGEASGVLLRGYLNAVDTNGNLDFASPDVEFVDRGSGVAPVFQEAGTWAITFGQSAEVFVDSWKARSDFVWPSSGVARPAVYQTMLELKTQVRLIASRGPATNINDDLLTMAIQDAASEVMDRWGADAPFMVAIETIEDLDWSSGVYTMPGRVAEVLGIWDAANIPVRFQRYGRDESGRLQVVANSAATTLTIRYRRQPAPMVDDESFCPIPREFDEVVRYGAALRVIEQRKNALFYETIKIRYEERMATIMARFNYETQQDGIAVRIDNGIYPSLGLPASYRPSW